jgi:hypothetical protein
VRPSDLAPTFIQFSSGSAPGRRYPRYEIRGAIASDVQGKNHHRREYVAGLTLPTGAGDIMRASPEDNAQLLCATIGGMG